MLAAVELRHGEVTQPAPLGSGMWPATQQAAWEALRKTEEVSRYSRRSDRSEYLALTSSFRWLPRVRVVDLA